MWIGVLYLLGGLVGIAMAIRSHRIERDYPTWPTAPGIVLERSVHASSGGRTSTRYVPQITYEYRVDGASYTSRATFAFLAKTFRTSEEAQRFVDGVAPTVLVHFDRRDPSRAYLFLQEAPRWFRPLLVAFGVLMLLVGLTQVVGP